MSDKDDVWDCLNGNIYNSKLFDLSECITELGTDEECIVSYAVYTEGDNKNDEYYKFRLISDYLQSAGKLIDTLDKNDSGLLKPHAGDDFIALPLLFIYTHSLELILKLLYDNIFFSGLSREKEYNTKDMKSHDLKKLVKIVKDIIPTNHRNDFEEIFRFIYTIDDTGLSSVGLRYCLNTNNTVNLIRKKQLNINIVKLHKSIIFILMKAEGYLENNVW